MPAALSAVPTISVVVPCYNAERYIAATLDSVLAQGWPGLQVVVVDDGSQDRSADVVTERFPQVTLLRQANQGVAAARNRGLAHANGEWIAFLDADDIWLPGKLHAQWQSLSQRPDARMAYTAWQTWPSDNPEPHAEFLVELFSDGADAAQWHGPSEWVYPQLLRECVVWTSTVLAHRSIFDEVGTFDPALHIGEDWDLWLRASRVTPILRVPRPLALYRLHPASITRSAPEQNWQNIVVSRALSRWGLRSPDGVLASKAEVDRALALSWTNFGGANLMAGQVRRARLAATTAIRADWRHLPGWKLLAKTVAPLFGTRGSVA